MPASPLIELRTGARMPRLGLGVWQATDDETERAVATALEAGYRMIDTAAAYRNEEGVGRGLRAAGLPREEVFVTTKLWNADRGYDSTLRAVDASLDRLGLDHVDLYLVHWPGGDAGVRRPGPRCRRSPRPARRPPSASATTRPTTCRRSSTRARRCPR